MKKYYLLLLTSEKNFNIIEDTCFVLKNVLIKASIKNTLSINNIYATPYKKNLEPSYL